MSPRPRVFVSRQIASSALERLQAAAAVTVWPDELPPSPAELRAAVAEVEGLLCMLTDRIDTALLEAAPRLRVISNHAVGYDNIDVAAATRRGIPVGNTPGILTETTADLAFGLLLAIARRIVEGDRVVRTGGWRTWHPGFQLGRDVHGATLGVVGLGRIGQAVARRARAFAMRILYYGPRRQPAVVEQETGATFVSALPELLAASDFVTVHAPLNAATHHLFDRVAFRAMRPTAYFINTSRGGLVDQAALAEALHQGWIAGAALDVTDPEPLPLDSPLLQAPNLIITPHVGSATVATRTRMAEMAVDNLLAGLRGERLPHCVNPEVYEALRQNPAE